MSQNGRTCSKMASQLYTETYEQHDSTMETYHVTSDTKWPHAKEMMLRPRIVWRNKTTSTSEHRTWHVTRMLPLKVAWQASSKSGSSRCIAS